MTAASNFLENEVLDHVLRNSAYTPPATVYLALFVSPGAGELETGTITSEVSGNGYARQAVTFSAAASGATSNSADIEFPVASGGAWGTITHVAVMDANAAGNVLFHGALAASKTIGDGDQFVMNAGDLDVSLD